MQLFRQWFSRFSDPQVMILLLILLAGFTLIAILGGVLGPLFASIVIAYLLEGPVQRMQRLGLPRLAGVALVFVSFLSLTLLVVFVLLPLLARQIRQLVGQVPAYVNSFQSKLLALPERYPQFITENQVNEILTSVNRELTALFDIALKSTLASVTGVITFVVLLVLVPVLVFFLMKDKDAILAWIRSYLPRDRALAVRVWREVDVQIGNYIRGKALEILIVGVVSFVTFHLFGLQYATLLATAVGFSVLIPYIGAAVVTIPIAIVGFVQFGWGGTFAWLMVAYFVIQILDGNALVPLLFSEVNNLHPVAIVVAVLLFGGLWGFWGVFFAIPLATLFAAVLQAVPRPGEVAIQTPGATATPE